MEEKPEVVISGVAGMFPECATVDELEKALFNKSHLITNDESHWELCYAKDMCNFPTHCGHAISHDKFDATFFNIPYSYPSVMDPQMKKCMEISLAAVIDAGLNPKELEGSRTAVYVTYDNSESECVLTYTIKEKVLMGNCRALTANRLSFALNLHGPSYAFQGGYGSVFHYFNHAKNEIQEGRLDAAIIVCANNIMSPRFLAVYNGMGLSSVDGKCRAFDEKAQGYAVSDTCTAFLLQRSTEARRSWATIIGADFKFIGCKRGGNFVSFDEEPAKKLLRQNYAAWKVDPATVEYVEADGCGIKERDDKEIDVIADTFCKNRRDPLLIGSVKSNMGHAETAAAAAGTVKALIALNKSKIPPNIHVTVPNLKLAPNKIRVVTDTTPLKGELVAVNAIGMAGGFGHVLLRKNPTKSSTMSIEEGLPQIMLMSSRTETGIEGILERVKTTQVTPEFAVLSNGVFRKSIKAHMFRGYTMVHADGTTSEPKHQKTDGDKRPIWWVFSGMGSQWNGMGAQLMNIPIFCEVIDKCDKILSPRGVDIKHVLTTDDKTIFDNILHSFVGIAAVQIGLVEILRALELEPDGIVGHSVGELGCAYADNCMTLEQTILAAYARGKASLESSLIKGTMAAIGLGNRDIIEMLPETIDVACQNSSTSCTISGPAADVEKFVAELVSKGVFAKAVNVANIAYHSRYIQPAGPILLKYLKEVIPINTKRSAKWVSSSVKKNNWFTDSAKYNSPEYHTNNLLSPVLFEDAITSIPSNAVVIEIAPHGLLQAILKKAVPETAVNVPLTKRTKEPEVSNVTFLLDAIGRLYLLGYSPNVSAIYPPVKFPVPCDTPSLQPFVTWEHSETYKLPDYMQIHTEDEPSSCEKKFSLEEIKDALRNYEDDDNPVLPLPFFLVEIWKIFGTIRKVSFEEIPIIFKDVHVHSELDLSKADSGTVSLSVSPGNGDFEVVQDWRKEDQQDGERTMNVLISGSIMAWETPVLDPKFEGFVKKNVVDQVLNTEEVGKLFSNCAHAKTSVRSRKIYELKVCSKGVFGKILWSNDWVINLDTITKAHLLKDLQNHASLERPSSVRFLRIAPDQMKATEEGTHVDFLLNSPLKYFECGGITVDAFQTKPMVERLKEDTSRTERLHFVPYTKTSFSVQQEFLLTCLQTIHENATMGHSTVSNTAFKLKTVQMKYSRKPDPIITTLEEIAHNSDGDLDMELELTDPSSCKSLTSDTCLLVLTDPNAILHISHMKNIEHVYLLTAMSKDTSLASVADYTSVYGQEYVVLYEQVFGTQRFGFLKKLIPSQKLRVYQVSKNWRTAAESLVPAKMVKDETAIMVINQPTVTNTIFTTQEILKTVCSHNVKCFLILDKDAPAFAVDNPLYRDQIKRGMIANVLINGEWGSYRNQPIPNLTSDFSRLLPLVDQASKEVDVCFVGLIPFGSETFCRNDSLLLDYSGIKNCNGEHVIGLAYSDTNKDIHLDPIFHWKQPHYVPLEDAVSLPYAYLMAHLVISDFIKHRGTKTLLIHSGHTSIGVACIAVALDAGHTVYTTVPNVAACETVARIFPQIPVTQITNYNDAEFYIPLMLDTNGRGADVIVSDLPRDKMLTSWSCIAQYGTFFNLNEGVTSYNSPLPMFQFLKSTSYLSYTRSDVIRMPESRKRHLHKLVEDFFKSEQAVITPHSTLTVEEVEFQPGLVNIMQNQGTKVVLNLGKSATNLGNKSQVRNGFKKRLTLCDPEQTYVILSSTIGKAGNLIEWLLDHSANKIVLATMTQLCSSHAVRRINGRITKQNASVLMTSASKAQSVSGAKSMLEQASLIGKVAAVFTVSLDQNVKAVKNIQEAVKMLKQKFPIVSIQGENSEPCAEDTISVMCDSSLDYTHVLNHAFTNPAPTAVYIVKKKIKTKRQKNIEETDDKLDKITDYLPISVEELTEIGKCLSARDNESQDQAYAEFFPVASLAPHGTGYKDVRPVFLIPALCETQLRPLISKLMYPCFVAHVHNRAPSLNQIALNLLKSMMTLQKRGPFTIVSETWSVGIAMLLSRLLSDAGHGVTLFMLHGIPARLCSMLPPQDALNEFLVSTLLGVDKMNNKQVFRIFDESQLLANALNVLALNGGRSHAVRAFTAIKKSLELLRSFAEMKVQLKDTLVLFEVEPTRPLTSVDTEPLSKKVEVIKSKCKTFRELLADPLVARTIAEQAPFSWDLY